MTLRARAQEFAAEIQDLLDATLPGARRMVAEDYENRFIVRTATTSPSPTVTDPIVLYARTEPVAKLWIWYRCRLDRSGAYLAVDESAFKLLTLTSTNPLLRLEFDQDQAPASHWHVHADRTHLGSVLAASGRPLPHDVAGLHLPAGGARLRPCLEDFLELLIREIGIDPKPGWEAAVATGRETWRRRQVRTAVRDVPGEAVTTLRSLGYEVVPPKEPPEDNVTAVRGY